MKRMVCGVGVNDADYVVKIGKVVDGKQKIIWRCPVYRTWASMLERCYSRKYQSIRPTYIGCSVSKEWLKFSEFRDWMISQDYDGMALDKDILFPGNKVYSQNSCAFVLPSINAFVNDLSASRGEWPLGVYWDRRSSKFASRCCNPFTGKQEYLGLFDCHNEAHEVWRSRKHQFACIYASNEKDPRISKALLNRYANKSRS